jgi:ferredoxin-NADP reductase
MVASVLNVLWIGGAVIVVAVIAYVIVLVAAAVARLSQEQRARDLQAEQLNVQIESARKKQATEAEKSLHWSGTRKFEVVRTEHESTDKQICSFYLKPHDEKPIPSFEPGQFLTFELKIPGSPGSVKRCYSLSDAPKEGVYRVSIKRVPAPRDQQDVPAGLSSNFFHDHVAQGAILDVRAPSGKFSLDMQSDRPIVLIGGGVGLTPVMSMLNAVVASGGDREVWFFYGVRNKAEHAMKNHLRAISAHSNVHLHTCYSKPDDDAVLGEDYDHSTRVGVELFKEVLPSNNYQFLICGPPPMMESLVADLQAWGVPKQDVLRESFGPASGRKAPIMTVNPDAQGPEVVFKHSGKTVHWDPAFDSLVKFAEANECDIPYACLAGNCGTCLTTIIKGEIDYQGNEPDFEAEQGTCLACSCVPNGPIELDA